MCGGLGFFVGMHCVSWLVFESSRLVPHRSAMLRKRPAFDCCAGGIGGASSAGATQQHRFDHLVELLIHTVVTFIYTCNV